MAKVSAGLLMYRRRVKEGFEVLLAHPGGPMWSRKDQGAWTIPKGEVAEGESPREAAIREFEEEIGFRPDSKLIMLGSIKQKGGKRVHAWAVQGDCDPAGVVSNTFEMEWPPRSGEKRRFPEIDRAAWFDLTEAERRINSAQAPWVRTLPQRLEEEGRRDGGTKGWR